MNNPLRYEQIIAAKMPQVSVPDIADSIWASVEQGLDSGLSADTNNEPSPHKGGSPGFSYIWIYVLTGIITIAVVAILLLKNKNNKATTQPPALLDTVRLKQEKRDSVTNEISDPVNDYPVNNDHYRLPPVQNSNNVFPPTGTKADSNLFFLPNNPVLIDTAQNTTLQTQPPSNPLLDTTGKKNTPPAPKGVKGITDDNYKIKTYKKDTTKG